MGLQCQKLLWFRYNAKDQIPAPDEAQQAIFDQGTEVGELAHQLFPGGTVVAPGIISPSEVVAETQKVSPDLTGVGSRYSRDVILDSILTPSLVLNSRFPATELRLRNGEVVTGTLVDLTDDKYVLAESQFHPEATTTIPRADVILEQPSATSPMPEGLLDSFTAEQIRDLFAFLEAQGDPDAQVFKKLPTRKPVPPTQP